VNTDSEQGYCTGQPVILSHLIGSSGEDFIVNGPVLSPAYFLANSGLDVWLINLRGNYHSRRHVDLDPDSDPRFWEYTLDNHIEDYRATIDYIIRLTGYQQVSIVGMAHGAATTMMALSDDPEWFTLRVNVFVALAPVTTLQSMTHPLFSMLFNQDVMEMFSFMGLGQVTETSCFSMSESFAGI
jgi:lysosomal acid lipase/cholesteryl ester hydrolase